jgi:GntR family transcriptional regulator, transcriptional repressor for pyruvate dehydrogenase complex
MPSAYHAARGPLKGRRGPSAANLNGPFAAPARGLPWRSPMLKPVEKQRVAEEIVDQLRTLILTGQYAPGSKLPPERELSKRLGVNRASLREALKKLEHLGLVRIRQGDGTRVQNFMETGGIELVQHLLPLAGSAHPELIRDMLEFRRIFGREVARHAAVRATDESLGRLEQLAERAERTSNMLDLFELDFEFYVALTQAAGNQVMGLLINTVRDGVRSHMPVLSNLAPSADLVRRHHRELIAALRGRDPDKAMRIADEYLRAGAEMAARLSARPELTPLPAPPL